MSLSGNWGYHDDSSQNRPRGRCLLDNSSGFSEESDGVEVTVVTTSHGTAEAVTMSFTAQPDLETMKMTAMAQDLASVSL